MLRPDSAFEALSAPLLGVETRTAFPRPFLKIERMERKRVNSGTIRSVGYEQSSRTLEIEFTSGSIFQYANVPADVYRRFLAAPTLASFFRDNIEEDYSARRMR